MNEPSDSQWLEGVAGRAAGESREWREGAALRAALAALPVPAIADPPLRSAEREEQLLTRARAAGLWQTRAPRRAWLAMAAGIVLAAAGLAWYMQTRAPVAVMRAAPRQAVRVDVADPLAAQQQLLGALRAAGIEAHGYRMLGRLGVDADLPQPVPQAVRAVLERQHLPPPPDGMLRVEFAARAAQ